VPFAHIENGLRLGYWVNVQRTNRNLLSADRRRRLDELGFVWNLLDAVWEEGFNSLKSYKHRQGHCLVPALHIENGFRLGSWVHGQRGKKAVISVERQHRLDALGFVWDVVSDQWERGFEYLKRYKEREGHCRVPSDYKENGFKLGQWVSVQRSSRETLSAENRKRLDALGFIWDALSDQWEHGFEHLKRYKERESHCRVPDVHTENGFSLGKWVGKQRQTRESMPVERRQRLDALGFVWDPLSGQWENGFTHLKSFREREGHCLVPALHKESGFTLGSWVKTQRKTKATMSSACRQQLDAIGFSWDSPHDSSWEHGFNYLKSYKEREGHCRVPRLHIETGFHLGSWVGSQRAKNDTLSPERRRRLDDLGFIWDASYQWENGFNHLKSFRERVGHCRVPVAHVVNGFRLGSWVRNQRLNKNMMSVDRRRRLDDLGFIWDASSDQWENGFSYLKAYKKRDGHCRVPFEHMENGFRLGGWVNVQRTKKRKLSADRRRRLDELGFVWNVKSDQWENGFSHLKSYKERQGHCLVPDNYIENGFRLGTWVGIQRANKNGMSADRRQRLNELGFVWNPLSDRWEKGFSCLKQYKQREGNCRVPALHVENNFKLGDWVRHQRVVKNTMPIERRKRLDKLGFAWKVR
jgi:uncharacterized protein (UPF0303 family)